MTDKETDFWIQMFTRGMDAYGDSELRASCFADRCLAELRKRTAIEPQPTEQDAAATVAELRKLYPWVTIDIDGDVADSRTGKCVVGGSGSYGEWRAYVTPAQDRHVSCSSLAEACKHVDWTAWDEAVKGDDE